MDIKRAIILCEGLDQSSCKQNANRRRWVFI